MMIFFSSWDTSNHTVSAGCFKLPSGSIIENCPVVKKLAQNFTNFHELVGKWYKYKKNK